MFILSMLAGMVICIGCLINLQIGGGIAGAIFFSVGLMSVIKFDFNLFTGKAGKFITGDIKMWQLLEIWFGNFCGVALVGTMALLCPSLADLRVPAEEILIAINRNGVLGNVIGGVLCGMLMYIAVNSESLIIIVFAVAGFILMKARHCVADMGYILLGARKYSDFLWLIPISFGNFIGCNLIPALKKLAKDFFIF